MPGGDLMDVLVAEARVIKRRIAQGTWKRACLAPKARYCPVQRWPLMPARPLLPFCMAQALRLRFPVAIMSRPYSSFPPPLESPHTQALVPPVLQEQSE